MKTEFKSQKIKSVLKELLKKKKITYESLAEQLECSIPTVKRILGPEELSLQRLLQLCEIVEIDLGELEVLIRQGERNDEEFTLAQQEFLAKNPSYFAYLMKLFGGDSPQQIAEKYKLSARSTDKYLIGLEKQSLIRVTGQQKVKPAFKNFPSFGAGVLAKAYYKSFIQNSALFFVDRLAELLSQPAINPEKNEGYFSTASAKITQDSYDAWTKEVGRLYQQFEKTASLEEKSRDPAELVTVVILRAGTSVPHDYAGLKTLEKTMGEIVNL